MSAASPMLTAGMRAALDDADVPTVLQTLAQELIAQPGLDFAWFGVESGAGRHATLACAGSGRHRAWLQEALATQVDSSPIIHLLLQAPEQSGDVGTDWVASPRRPASPAAAAESLMAMVVMTSQRPWYLALLGLPPHADPAFQQALLQDIRWLLQRADQRTRERQLILAMEQAGNSMFLTRADGEIIWLNAAFTRLTGYSEREALGRNPRILKSGRQGARYYQDLWRTISSGEVWSSETVDKDRFGYLYAIDQTISPVLQEGQVTHYLSVHADVTRKRVLRMEAERVQSRDPLTGLLNPTSFRDELNTRLKRSADGAPDFAVASLSLPGLRFAADNRDCEQLALEAVAERLRAVLARDDLAASMGPQDFALLLNSAGSAAAVEACRQKLEAGLREPLSVGAQAVQLLPRLAFALYPDDGTDADTLWRCADDALAGDAR